MSKLGAITFMGKTNHRYEFALYPLETHFKAAAGGVFVITARQTDAAPHHSHHQVLCIGASDDLSQPPANLADLIAQGANCVAIHVTADAAARTHILDDLCAHYPAAARG